MHIFDRYFKSNDKFTHSGISGDFVPKATGHKFPAVTYYPDKQPNLHRVMIVEAMDTTNATWDVKKSDAYTFLKGLDATQSAHKALGVLSAGHEFVLFEVTGGQDPKLLLGASATRASLLDEKTSLDLEKFINEIKTSAKSGKCKAFTPQPDPPAAKTGLSRPVTPVQSTKGSRSNSPVPRVGSPSTATKGATNVKAKSVTGNGGKVTG